MKVTIEPVWKAILAEEFEKPYFKNLMEFVSSEYNSTDCFPPQEQIFSAFNHTPFDEVKVVIIGQDPYHDFGQAHGLCFSVNEGVKIPPSLKNIYEGIRTDVGSPVPEGGNLKRWADQGVLLLNATLTVRAHQAGSHKSKGWEKFTDAVIEKLSDEREGIVFMLWGNYAKKMGKKIDRSKHEVIETIHPSPLSVNKNKEGWFGIKQFSAANDYLITKGKEKIIW
ncbi:Uracil-DNA glycosylase [Aequorivita sublithincola DSM 14238]|uniref:Uracil-DNA glycosylase n=1 Tax=Aequorivita sublithincola (strain DSM 14238 / LMG 21431 / ACAM 643 / 9-3) TaxID=746697 RepID=I3YYV9_AEQSU|nr:uracil-DNA glycosylase [Aequorivita sublithincola]AFL82177.1 Uracil-DNA glycosylase [Aequorivita sublithincola DSM 14238]